MVISMNKIDFWCKRKEYKNKITRKTFQSSNKLYSAWLDFLTLNLAYCTHTCRSFLLLLLVLKENGIHWLVCCTDSVDLLLELLWDLECWSGRSNVGSKTRITKPWSYICQTEVNSELMNTNWIENSPNLRERYNRSSFLSLGKSI